jgi:membrane-associated phospholipid phosphatase
MIEAFGGSAPYVGVWRITDYCVSNCSFVAGEASSAVWLIGLALVVPKAWRKAAAIALAAYALILSINRIAFGGHFVSDVLLAWGLTALVMLVLYRLMVASPPAWLAHERLEANLAAIGRRLRSRPPR